MQSEIPDLDRKGLRQFGIVTGAILTILFGVFFPWLLKNPYPYWPWIFGGAMVFWALLAPHTLRRFYRRWMQFAFILSRISTPLIMGIVFILVITPAALITRLAGKDPMARQFDADAESYRVESKKILKENMEKPF